MIRDLGPGFEPGGIANRLQELSLFCFAQVAEVQDSAIVLGGRYYNLNPVLGSASG